MHEDDNVEVSVRTTGGESSLPEKGDIVVDVLYLDGDDEVGKTTAKDAASITRQDFGSLFLLFLCTLSLAF